MNTRAIFKGEGLNEISFPLGGIGTGSIGLAGNGRLYEWEIFNRPNKGGDNGSSHFAVKAVKNGKTADARVLHSDCTTNLAGTYNHGWGFGMGLSSVSMAGFPHFRNAVFTGEFPIAKIDFEDDSFPGKASLTAFNPLIPHDEDNSGIPAAFFAYSITNTTDGALDYAVAAVLRNPHAGSVNEFRQKDGVSALFLKQTKLGADDPDFGDMTLATDTEEGVCCQEYWYRGGWTDGPERYWRNFTEETAFPVRRYDTPGNTDTGTLMVTRHAEPGETVVFRFVIAWNRPNCRNYWDPFRVKDAEGNEREVTWKNYYARLFENSLASARYSLAKWDELYAKTLRWHDELFSSSLPDEVVEAVASTVSVLKSPTVLRLENGEFYGWEGTWETRGSCEGTCTHVWNYAYALCFLFPRLERSIRETDFTYNQSASGRMGFRMQLPLGRGVSGFRACVDGQMGGVIKTWREWKLSGDDAWLRGLWDKVKRSLAYAWSESNRDRWDRDHDGVLEGRQHHTLDVELFGPSSWLEGFYLAALKCGAEMADRMDDPDFAAECRELFEKGKAWSDANLFNGKWYCQKIDLTDRTLLEPFGETAASYWNEESGEIKYQIGEGSEIDQCLAQWHANIGGLGEIYDKKQLRTALENLYRNNFLHDMRSHYNTFRLFAVNDEAGAVICTWPDGTKMPAIPIPYAQESMHGFEYALAGLMISEGMIREGEEIVRAIRDRYRGFNRNPYSEIECGSNYARSMASFALLPIYERFRFEMQDNRIGFDPILPGAFRAPFFTGSAWGRFEKKEGETVLTVFDGTLSLRELCLPYLTKADSVTVDGKDVPFAFDRGTIRFAADVRESVTVR